MYKLVEETAEKGKARRVIVFRLLQISLAVQKFCVNGWKRSRIRLIIEGKKRIA
jgi:hypothetical protein